MQMEHDVHLRATTRSTLRFKLQARRTDVLVFGIRLQLGCFNVSINTIAERTKADDGWRSPHATATDEAEQHGCGRTPTEQHDRGRLGDDCEHAG
jgi:hypothetical protein